MYPIASHTRARPWQRWFAAVAAINAGIAVSYVGLWLISMARGLSWRADFTAYYTAWTMVRAGAAAQVYDFAVQAVYQQRVLGGRSFSEGLLPYVNPPHVTLFFAPLAWLTLPHAFYLWTAGQVVLIVVLIRTTLALTADWLSRERLAALCAMLAFPPLLFTLLRGSFSLLVLVAVLGLYRYLIARRPGRAGLWLAMASMKPQLVLLPALAMLVGRRWRVLLASGLAGIACVLAATVAFGPQSWLGFLQAIRTIDGYYGIFGIVPATMYNLKGTLTLWLGNERGELIGTVSTIAFALGVCATLWLWRRPWEPGSSQFALRFAQTVLLGLVLSPHLHSHDGLVLVAPVLIVAQYLYTDPARRHLAAGFTLVPLITLLGEFGLGGALGIRVPTLLMILLGLWLAREIRRCPD